jgi:hypothetical protein
MSGLPHGGTRPGAGRPRKVRVTDEMRSQLFTGPSLSVPGVAAASGTIHPFFGVSRRDTAGSVLGVDPENATLSPTQPIVSQPDTTEDVSHQNYGRTDAGTYYLLKI